MKHTFTKVFTASAVAALLLSGCSLLGGDNDTSDSGSEEDPVYAEMASWDACEVLDYLQPITDYMGIKGYGSSTAEGGEPGNSEIGNTLDPDAIGCNGLIYLGSYADTSMSGEIKVKIVPSESEDQATAAYEERVAAAEGSASQGEEAATSEFADPWAQGTVVSWIGDAEQPHIEVIARDGQWVFHIDLYHSTDLGLYASDEAALSFTEDELSQWFVETYLPEVNQAVNDRIAEVQ